MLLLQALEARKRLKALLQDKLLLDNNNGLKSSLLHYLLEDMKSSQGEEEDVAVMYDVITDTALELLFGGQETLSCVLTCAMMLLKQNPDTLHKLREQVDRYASCAMLHNVTDEKYFDSFPYVDYVIKETLRLYPAVGGGFRKAKVDIEVNVSCF